MHMTLRIFPFTAALVALSLASVSQAQLDFGDAPAGYGTLLASGAAAHPVSANLRLGLLADTEPDGQPGALANGDDVNGLDDDDGVEFFSQPSRGIIPWQAGAWTQVRVKIKLSVPVTEAGLDGWVDFNRNGAFDVPGERIFNNVRLTDIGNQNEGWGHTLGVWVPQGASPGTTVARFRLSEAGGQSPTGVSAQAGEVEDYLVEIVQPSPAGNVRAHVRHGQVWIAWDCDPAAPAQAYDIYKAAVPFVNVSNATPVARLFPQEYAAANLVSEMREAFGEAAGRDHFTIPAANPNDPDVTLTPGQGLCVDTVRTSGLWYYAVVPRGVTAVPPASITALPVNALLATAGSPRLHVQQTGLVGDGAGSQYRVTFLNMWTDGDAPGAAARADFPLMASAARRCVPHLCILMAPETLPAGSRPLTFAGHGGDARASMWLPGGTAWNNTGCAPAKGFFVSLEDRLHQINNGIPAGLNTAYLGYVPAFDPFDNVQSYEGMLNPQIPQQLPAANAEIQPYTLTRQNWILDQLLADTTLNIDPDRVCMIGHSAGGKGTMNWVRTSPQRFAAAVCYNAEMGNNMSFGTDVGRFGYPMMPPDETGVYGPPRPSVSQGQNLRVAGLTTRTGGEVRFNDFYDLRREIHPVRDLPPMQFWYGLREQNWSEDFDHTTRPDVQEILEVSDAGGTGAVLYWDVRKHGVDTWTFLAGCGFTPADYWVPSAALQTRRDDPDTLARHRRTESWPAFHRLAGRTGHDDPGVPDYGVTPPFFDTFSPWSDPTPNPCWPEPEITGGDLRGTWGGWFDWVNGVPATDERALRETPDLWAATLFLTADRDGAGTVLTPGIDECPSNILTADVAIRRPQSFLPAAGVGVEWMNCEQTTRRVLQAGRVTVGADTVVGIPDVAVPKAPAAVRLVVATQLDFGDAPAGYPVSLAEDGARHASDGAVFLGTGRTAETDGNHHASALLAAEGDDGVSGPAQWTQGSVVTLTITVNAACRLDAWVDWARNNAWSSGEAADAKDQIAAALALTAGVNTLKVLVPDNAVPGVSFARFRVSLGGCLEPVGPAPDGEVEDYPLVIATLPPGTAPDALTVTRDQNGDTVLHWTGRSDWSWQIEHSTDLINWLWINLPAAEINGAMSYVLPAELMAGPRRCFRVRHDPMVNEPVLCVPGSQLNLSFVHTNGSRTRDQTTGSWRTGSIARNYHVYVPSNWHPGRTWPLILMLHGHSMTGATLAGTQSELRSIANDRGFITVFPDSTASERDRSWFSYPDPAVLDPARIQNYVDDKAFLFSLVSHLVNNTGLRVDATRLYCAGFSNGGATAHYISADINHPFRAFAIMESGTQSYSFFEPRYLFNFGSGSLLPAKPRPCILMNMVTSAAWPYEGQPVFDSLGQPLDINQDGIPDRRPTARQNVQRWLDGNNLTAPPVVVRHAFVNEGTVAADLPAVENHFIRPDAWWPASRKALYAAAYADLPEAEIPDIFRAPAQQLDRLWFQNPANLENLTSYPHLTFTEDRHTFTVAGTWSEETWATPSGQSDREVKFLTLSDGGHQWPGANDRVGWDGQLGVMDFFSAH